jgi:hypothetical protein
MGICELWKYLRSRQGRRSGFGKAMELVEKREGLYHNTALASKYLAPDGSMFLGGYLQAYYSSCGFDDLDIVKSVKEGPADAAREKEGLEKERPGPDGNTSPKLIIPERSAFMRSMDS